MNQRNGQDIRANVDVGAGHGLFDKIVSLENLLVAWREFRRGKRSKPDVQKFELNLEDNLFKLHYELVSRTYQNDPYDSFYITDPKLRHIHKASVRDRVVHQAIFRVLYPMYERSFIFDSYSCRVDKGTHLGVARLERFLGQVSRNVRGPAYALKCDVKKFFDTVDHQILLSLMEHKSHDLSTRWLISQVVDSFETQPGKGLPLGNVTSQLFSNVYLNELDEFMKHRLRVQHYLRYCDDFVVLADNREYLEDLVPKIGEFLQQTLKLELHQKKIELRKYNQGIDFLGYVVLPHHRVLRSKTKTRMFRKLHRRLNQYRHGIIARHTIDQSLNSYLGMLKHCRGYSLSVNIKNIVQNSVSAIH